MLRPRQPHLGRFDLRRLGRPERLKRNAIERVICVLQLFHIFCAHGGDALLAAAESGLAAPRFDVEAVMRDIEANRATIFPGVPTMWIAIAALPDLDQRDSRRCAAQARAARRAMEVARILSARSA